MINKLPQINVVFDRRKKATSTVKSSLELRITYNYKQKYISTGIKLHSNQWKKGRIVNCPDILKISQILDTLLNNVREVLLCMLKEGKVDIYAIPERLKLLEKDTTTFIEFCKQRAEIRKYGKQEDTKERYERFLRLFLKWGRIKDFNDITDKNILLYDEYLAGTGMKNYSKWNNYHRFLNSFIIDAIDAGYLNKNPYKWVNIEKNKSITGINKYLTQEEFEKLKKATMPTKSLERVRDLFVFQTYTCMSYTDLASFDSRKLHRINGREVYSSKRHKTQKEFVIPILPPAFKILVKYDYTLPIISNVKYNEYLKLVAQAAKIDKPVSSHWARHTGATLLLNKGIEMKIISKICGHSSVRITEQVYAKLLDSTVIEALKEIDI